MAMREMDYFNQKPDLDMKAFFETRGIRLSDAEPRPVAAAPPPKDTAWVIDKDVPDTPDGEEQ